MSSALFLLFMSPGSTLGEILQGKLLHDVDIKTDGGSHTLNLITVVLMGNVPCTSTLVMYKSAPTLKSICFPLSIFLYMSCISAVGQADRNHCQCQRASVCSETVEPTFFLLGSNQARQEIRVTKRGVGSKAAPCRGPANEGTIYTYL